MLVHKLAHKQANAYDSMPPRAGTTLKQKFKKIVIACPLARGDKIKESSPRVHTRANKRALHPPILRARTQ